MTQAQSSTTPINDDIDLINVFKTLWANKTKFILTIIVSTIIAAGYILIAPKEYKSQLTFFVNSDSPGSLGLGMYSSVLGLGTPANISGLITNVVTSESMKQSIATQFRPQFEPIIQDLISQEKLIDTDAHINAYIIGKLGLYSNVSLKLNRDKLFILEYSSEDLDLVKPILDEYLSLILMYNSKLELSAKKNLITVIDEARVPLKHFWPNKKLILVLVNLLGLFSMLVFVLMTQPTNRN